MKLNFQQIQSITLGAAYLSSEEDGIHFHRFTPEEEEIYRKKGDGVPTKQIFATSGICLSFKTDSKRLGLKISAETASSTRRYFSVDVFQNGKFLGSIQNFDEALLPRKYTHTELPFGDFSEEFDLKEGEEEITVVFPALQKVVLQEISLSDGADLTPIKKEKKLLCYGDSITQGYDALHAHRRYTARLADALGMEEFNKAIGGEKFFPELSAAKPSFRPDLITVAYGTNDWSGRPREVFEKTCIGFFENLVKSYPDTPILAITPLWRKIWQREKPCGPFLGIDAFIRKVCGAYPNVTVLSGFDLIPHDADYFADFTLHPNAVGYDRYAEGILKFLEENPFLLP